MLYHIAQLIPPSGKLNNQETSFFPNPVPANLQHLFGAAKLASEGAGSPNHFVYFKDGDQKIDLNEPYQFVILPLIIPAGFEPIVINYNARQPDRSKLTYKKVLKEDFECSVLFRLDLKGNKAVDGQDKHSCIVGLAAAGCKACARVCTFHNMPAFRFKGGYFVLTALFNHAFLFGLVAEKEDKFRATIDEWYSTLNGYAQQRSANASLELTVSINNELDYSEDLNAFLGAGDITPWYVRRTGASGRRWNGRRAEQDMEDCKPPSDSTVGRYQRDPRV